MILSYIGKQVDSEIICIIDSCLSFHTKMPMPLHEHRRFEVQRNVYCHKIGFDMSY